MNNLRNRVQLIGRIGAEPEVRELESGRQLARLRIATNDGYMGKDGKWVEDTQWHNVVAWGKNAEYVEKHFEKGQEILVEGSLKYSKVESKDGERYYTDVVAGKFIGLQKSNKAD